MASLISRAGPGWHCLKGHFVLLRSRLLDERCRDRGTIQLLEGIAGDVETDREVRETARAVAAALVKQARAK